MARFCEQCPLRGSCNDKLVGRHAITNQVKRERSNKSLQTGFAVLTDRRGGMSKLLYLLDAHPHEVTPDAIFKRVDSCEEPDVMQSQTIAKGVLRRFAERFHLIRNSEPVPTYVCPAIGNLAVANIPDLLPPTADTKAFMIQRASQTVIFEAFMKGIDRSNNSNLL